MLRSSRLIGFTAALALSVFSTASLATVVLNTPLLTGSVVAKNFADGTPDTFDVNFSNMAGTVTAVALPNGIYNVSGQGIASFINTPGGGTTNIPILSPLLLFSGALSSTGITAGTYTGTFVAGAPHTVVYPNIGFTINYDGQTSSQVLAILNALVGSPPNAPVYIDPQGAGTLDVTGVLYMDGIDFSFTESNLKNWGGFGSLLSTIDQMEGGDNGIIDGDFVLRNVVVTAELPEPAPLALIGLALASLAWVRRRRS